MSRILPQEGTYQARLNGHIIVRAEESGALMAYIPYSLTDSEVKFADIHALCLGKKDGTLQAKAVAVLREVFPDWNGLNPFELEAIEPNEDKVAQFELADCHAEEYTPKETEENPNPEPQQRFKASWFNKLGGSASNIQPMEESEKKTALTRWSSKFKAIAGKKPAAKVAAEPEEPETPAPKKGAPPVKPKQNGPPSRKSTAVHACTSTGEEVWDLLTKWNEAQDEPLDEGALGEKYWAAAKEQDESGELTIQQWGAVADALGL